MRNLFSVLFLLSFLFSSIASADVIADTAAPLAQQPVMDTAPNGVPVVNITTPTPAGVSVNKFTEFSVDTPGVIMNNSSVDATSQLGGMVIGNSNVSGNPAQIIVSEVTSTNPSELEGAIEIHGPKAAFVLANPNGITCKGCGFINHSRTTLTTGTPHYGAGGTLDRFDVDRGEVMIKVAPPNLAGTDSLDIHARAVAIAKAIDAGTLSFTVIAGRNEVTYDLGGIYVKVSNGSAKPEVSIDMAPNDAWIKAGSIRMLITEKDGVGNLASDITSNLDDFEITADGELKLKANVLAARNAKIESQNGKVTNEKNILAGNTVEVKGKQVQNQGRISGDGGTTVEAHSIDNRSGTIHASNGITTVKVTNSNTTDYDHSLNNEGGVIHGQQGTTVHVEQVVNNKEGAIFSSGGRVTIAKDATLARTQAVYNESGYIHAAQDTHIATEQLIQSQSNLQMETVTLREHSVLLQDLTHATRPPADKVREYSVDTYRGAWLEEFFVYGQHYYKGGRKWNPKNYYYEEQTGKKPALTLMERETRPVANGSAPSLLTSTQTLTLDVGLLDIDGSHIASYDHIHFLGKPILRNTGYLTEHTLELHCEAYHCDGYNSTTGERILFYGKDYVKHTTGPAINSTISAVGNITGDITGLVNATLRANVDTGTLDTLLTTTQPPTLTSVFPTANHPTKQSLSTMPAFSALFTFAPAASNYYIETKGTIVDQTQFYNSDYFWNRIGYTPSTTVKRLGDPYYETRYIQQQLLEQAAVATLTSAIANAERQVQQLLDNAVNAYFTLNLTPTVALTAAQMAALTDDILWYEIETVDGQLVLIPKVYRAGNKKAKQGAVITANNVTLNADQKIQNYGGHIQAGQAVHLTATEGIEHRSTVQSVLTTHGQQSYQAATASITAGNTVDLLSNNRISVTGASINSGSHTTLSGVHGVDITATTLNNYYTGTQGGTTTTADSTTHLASVLTSGGNVALNANQGAIQLQASTITAAGKVTANGEQIHLQAAQDSTYTQQSTTRKGGLFGNTSTTTDTSYQSTTLAPKITAGQAIELNANSGISLQAAKLNAGQEIALSTQTGTIDLLATKDTDYQSHTANSKNLVWQKQQGSGHQTETIHENELTSGTNDIRYLSPLINHQTLTPNNSQWSYKAQGLTPEASTLVSVIVAVTTQGTGSALLSSATGSTLGTVSSAAANAAYTSLASQGTISAINNSGNPFRDLDGKQFATSVITAGATQAIVETAGLQNMVDPITQRALSTASLKDRLALAAIQTGTSSVVSSAINGHDLKDTLIAQGKQNIATAIGGAIAHDIGSAYYEDAIDPVTHKLAHAAVGCGVGAVSGNCAAGAIGSVVGEMAAEQAFKQTIDPNTSANIGRIAAASAGLLTDTSVSVASDTATMAVENNFAPHAIAAIEAAALTWMVYDAYQAYQAGGWEEAAKVLTTNGLIMVSMGPGGKLLYKFEGKVYDGIMDVLQAFGRSPKVHQTVEIAEAKLANTVTKNVAESQTARKSSQLKEHALREGDILYDLKIYPPNNGAVPNTTVIETLKPGYRIDRYGKSTGSYVSPFKTDFDKRALPRIQRNDDIYRAYEVVEPIENVETSIIAPYYGYKGGGTQHKLPESIESLLDKEYLKKIKK